jgi:hypothetical protein
MGQKKRNAGVKADPVKSGPLPPNPAYEPTAARVLRSGLVEIGADSFIDAAHMVKMAKPFGRAGK